ncbi:MAG TPA: mechanosensitive ion channel domain-containing protein [Longimicrobiaceae bacterium]|nr:mechanosensitive ion channel domain-containing protein [Longimicrobiaceae bacterium]
MIQTPLPIPDSLQIDLPVPGAFEHWRDLYLQSGAEKLVVFFGIAFVLYLFARLSRQVVSHHVEDVNRRHVIRKWVTYAYVVLLLMVAVALFADWLTGLGAILALLIAAAAVALQDVLKSLVGWIYLSGRAGIEIGSRIEVNGIIGDVIDIGMLKTTMLEVGGTLVYGRQSTGRLVTVPNYRMLADAVLISAASSPYVWNEIRITVTFESDWRRAEEIMKEVGDEIHAEVAPELQRGFRYLERRYAFKYGALTPIIYVSIGPSGVELTLRFLVHVRRRRGAIDHASRRILAALAAEPNVRIAYTTYRVYRSGEPVGDGRPAPVMDEGARGVGPDEGMVVEDPPSGP